MKYDFLEELYSWIEPKQKEFLLKYVTKDTLLKLLLNSGIQLSDLQYCISNRSSPKERFCPPDTPYIMHLPTTVSWFDPEFKVTRTRVTYNYTVPLYNIQVQLMVLRHLGLYIPVYCYESTSQDSLYGTFDSTNVNIGMVETFNRDFKAIKSKMEASVLNSVEYQPRESWRKENGVSEITVKGQWDKIKKSVEWKELQSWCKSR